MRRWEELRPQLDERGVQIVTVCTDSPSQLRKGLHKHGAKAVMLSDSDLSVTRLFNVENTNTALRPPGLEGLPIPTTILVDAKGIVRWIDQSDDYMVRSEPDRVLAALELALQEPAVGPATKASRHPFGRDAFSRGRSKMSRSPEWLRALAVLAGLLAQTASSSPTLAETKSYSPYAGEAFPRTVFWGDTHVHSSWSVDAGNAGNIRVTPELAYRFARGEEITAHNGMRVRLRRPLDFFLLSDHAEYLGVMPLLDVGDPLARSTATGERWYRLRKEKNYLELFREFAYSMLDNRDVLQNEELKGSVWLNVIANAERYNEPGVFTAFIGFEWTSIPDGNNRHRNVLFRDGAEKVRQVLPYSSFDSLDPEDLWAYLSEYESKTGGRVLAIPHNSNLSGGQMFAVETVAGEPLDRDYAERRMRFEPVVEATQYKGDSETHPILSPDDEFADYETWDLANLGGRKNRPEMLRTSYLRSALGLGLDLAARLGVNPFKFGMIGSTDSHTGMAAGEENNFWGKTSENEARPGRWNDPFFPDMGARSPPEQYYEWQMAASGYAAVWARENTRAAIFDAIVRKETYATTGPRMVLRMFGGWGFEPGDEQTPDLAAKGYAGGVPMGGDLAGATEGQVPRFLVAAQKDPGGANLDRVQVIKGWRDAEGALRERVYDIAVSGERKIGRDGRARRDVGSTVDVENASYLNSIGAAELSAVWKDPDFDPREPAFYYVRVIEIPKPRWTAYDARYFGAKLGDDVPMVTRDRAYSSPIWYTPTPTAP